jgi:hypothetical protein
MNWIANNWEKYTFRVVGLVVFAFATQRLLQDDITGFATLFGVAFFCFFYANISRFKKFKGLGFEAELWEDKQREAEQLIERLRSIVNKALTGRFASGKRWRELWQLHDEIAKQHAALGAKIDFSDTKRQLWQLFIFDLLMPNYQKLHRIRMKMDGDVSKKINSEYPAPISDSDGYGRRLAQRGEVSWTLDPPFALAKEGKLAAEMLRWFETTKQKAMDTFGVALQDDAELLSEIKRLAGAESDSDMRVTEELIALSERDSD